MCIHMYVRLYVRMYIHTHFNWFLIILLSYSMHYQWHMWCRQLNHLSTQEEVQVLTLRDPHPLLTRFFSSSKSTLVCLRSSSFAATSRSRLASCDSVLRKWSTFCSRNNTGGIDSNQPIWQLNTTSNADETNAVQRWEGDEPSTISDEW